MAPYANNNNNNIQAQSIDEGHSQAKVVSSSSWICYPTFDFSSLNITAASNFNTTTTTANISIAQQPLQIKAFTAYSTTTARSSSAVFFPDSDGTKQPKREVPLSPQDAANASLRNILNCFEQQGLSKHSLQELSTMLDDDDNDNHSNNNETYLLFMARAEEYAECLISLSPTASVDTIVMLFRKAWTALGTYSKQLFQEARRNHARYESTQWEAAVLQQTHYGPYITEHWEIITVLQTLEAEHQQEQRQQRRLAEYDVEHVNALIKKVNEQTRFKMDCTKGLVLVEEWSRYLRAQAK